jgi:hypothetical protein
VRGSLLCCSSAADQTVLRFAGQVGGHSLRLLHVLATVVLSLLGVAVLGVGALAWRLSEGPISLYFLASRLERIAEHDNPGVRMSIGSVSLAWEGFRRGVDQPVDLRLTDMRAFAPDGTVIDDVPRAAVSISLFALLQGDVALRAVEVDGARLRVLRRRDGSTTLDLGGTGSALPGGGARNAPRPFASLLSDLARPAGGDNSHAAGERFRQFRRVLIRDAEVEVTDRQLGATWRANPATIDLVRQPQGGVVGNLDIVLVLGDSRARLTATATLQPGGLASEVHAALTPVTPAVLAQAIPALAPLAAFDAPVTLAVTADLGPSLILRHLALHATAGAGQVHVAQSTVALSAITLDADGDTTAMKLDGLRLTLTPPGGGTGPVITVQGDAARSAGRFTAHAAIDVDRVAFADLARYWPAGTGGGARPWLVENITAGTAHDGHVALTVEGAQDMSNLALTAASGQILGDDLTVWWLRPIPPIEHAQAKLILLGPDTLEIDDQGGRQASDLTLSGRSGIALHDGTMRITGLTAKDQFGAITANLGGHLADALALLGNPRLGLLSAHPIDVRDPAGSFTTKLTVQIPLDANVKIDDIAIHAASRLADVHLGAVVAGHDLDHGAIDLDVTNDGLAATGTADLVGIASTLALGMDFRAGPPSQVLTHATVSGTTTDAQLAGVGIDTGGRFKGSAALGVTYAQMRDGTADLQTRADLKNAALDAEPLDWTKAAGAPATASAHVTLLHDRITAINEVQATAPGLLVRGHAGMVGGQPRNFHLDRFQIGKTDVSGDVDLGAAASDPIRVNLSGPQVDLSARLSGKGASPAKPGDRQDASDAPGRPWSVDARVDRVLLAEGHLLSGVTLSVRDDGRVIRQARFASIGARADIVPDGSGRRLSASTGDLGALLGGLDVTDAVRGGSLSVDGRFDDTRADHPLSATADASDFTLLGVPRAAKVLQALSIYGLADALRGPGLRVDRMVAPFRYADDVLELDNARAASPSLGVTAEGRIDLARDSADLQGTIIPAYMVNSLLGRVPILGRLFSPEKGGGVFAATFSVRGRLADPTVVVNPLAALTPGFLRGVFDIFNHPQPPRAAEAAPHTQ